MIIQTGSVIQNVQSGFLATITDFTTEMIDGKVVSFIHFINHGNNDAHCKVNLQKFEETVQEGTIVLAPVDGVLTL